MLPLLPFSGYKHFLQFLYRKTENDRTKTEPDRANLIPWGPPEDEFVEDYQAKENGKIN